MTISKIGTKAWMVACTLALLPALAHAEKPRKSTPAKAQTVEITVTENGFELKQPATVKAGQPVKLVVTRKVERTCMTEIVLQDYGINQPLPLDKTVEVTFTPKKPGPIQYSCGMGMGGPPIVAQ